MTLRDALLRGRRRPRTFGSGSPTTYRGDGYEFVELREYVPGDDVRRIDWAATARSGELQTRVVLEDIALTLAAIVDDTPSMHVGRQRSMRDAAQEALVTWFGAAASDDRCIRVANDSVTPPRQLRGARAAHAALADIETPFDMLGALQTARAALPRGTALLAIGDWYDVDSSWDALLSELGTRFDCTALIARDPWFEHLAIGGLIRMRGAEGGAARVFVGKRERARFDDAVRAREASLFARFERTNWRTGLLREESGRASLAQTFGLHELETHNR